MDDFIKAQSKDVGKGGYRCSCCCPVGGKRKAIQKRARTRLKFNLVVRVKEVNNNV